MDTREKITNFIKSTGPILPVKLAKHLNTNIIIASAHLSELSSRGIVKISNVKVGGSPIYYLPDQKDKLQSYSQNLNEKEREAYNLLQEKKVLRNDALPPSLQVAIKCIKDFAVPLSVSYANKKEIFWKWFLSTEADARQLINNYINTPQQKIQQSAQPKREQPATQNTLQQSAIHTNQEMEKFKQEQLQREAERTKRLEEEKLKQEELRIKERELLHQEKQKIEQERKQIEEERKKIEQERELLKKQHTKGQRQEQLQVKIQEEQQEAPAEQHIQKEIKDPFFDEVKNQLENKKIKIVSCEVKAKNKELDLLVEVPSPVGDLTYYCKAKNKKRISDSDLSSAFVQGQLQKLPVLFLSKGDLTKKAQDMIEKEFKGMSINKI